jgi:hypothetical protein
LRGNLSRILVIIGWGNAECCRSSPRSAASPRYRRCRRVFNSGDAAKRARKYGMTPGIEISSQHLFRVEHLSCKFHARRTPLSVCCVLRQFPSVCVATSHSNNSQPKSRPQNCHLHDRIRRPCDILLQPWSYPYKRTSNRGKETLVTVHLFL